MIYQKVGNLKLEIFSIFSMEDGFGEKSRVYRPSW